MTRKLLALVLLAFIIVIFGSASAFADSGDKKESKKEIKQIERAQAIDEDMELTEIKSHKPVKKERPPEQTFQQTFQARQGFQQQPLINTGERR